PGPRPGTRGDALLGPAPARARVASAWAPPVSPCDRAAYAPELPLGAAAVSQRRTAPPAVAPCFATAAAPAHAQHATSLALCAAMSLARLWQAAGQAGRSPHAAGAAPRRVPRGPADRRP